MQNRILIATRALVRAIEMADKMTIANAQAIVAMESRDYATDSVRRVTLKNLASLLGRELKRY